MRSSLALHARRMLRHRSSLANVATIPPPDVVPILLLGHPQLFKTCAPVFDGKSDINAAIEEQAFIARQLCATAAAHNSFGLAAPQVGHMKRMFVVVRDWVEAQRTGSTSVDDYDIYVDPTMDISMGSFGNDDNTQVNQERCLSIPGAYGMVTRHDSVHISYVDGNNIFGKQKQQRKPRRVLKKLVAFRSAIFQHELDHLDGVLYLDRMDEEVEVVEDVGNVE